MRVGRGVGGGGGLRRTFPPPTPCLSPLFSGRRVLRVCAACQQRTLTPLGTWSCPTLRLASVLIMRPISPELVSSFEHPRLDTSQCFASRGQDLPLPSLFFFQIPPLPLLDPSSLSSHPSPPHAHPSSPFFLTRPPRTYDMLTMEAGQLLFHHSASRAISYIRPN